MSDDDKVSLLIVEQFKQLRNELRDMRNSLHEGLDGVKSRLSSLEGAVVNLGREVNHAADTDARIQTSLDRIDRRIERIERRAELVDVPPRDT